MSVHADIESKLNKAFKPLFLQVENESDGHNVPKGSESHFKVTLVSSTFEGRRKVARHQSVYQVLKLEMSEKIHALALHTYTAEEWQDVAAAPGSPDCLGGSKSK